MNKKHGVNRLGTELALAALFSALIAILLYTTLNYLGYGALDRFLLREDVIASKEKGCIDRLQSYVTSNHLASSDKDRLDQWADSEKNLFITLYRGTEVLYSNDSKVAAAISNINEEADQTFVLPWNYDVGFSDGTAKAVINYFFEAGYYMAVNALSGLLSAAVFMMVLFLFIRKKVDYITLLEREIQILKGGDLDYHITIRGKDELASLAAEMDAMRCAVKERQDREEMAGKANRDLVTAMSHDLRTPLTSLLGYADILQMERYKDEEQRRRCILAIRDKAYQIKGMSDKMFEYFLVYGKDQEEICASEVNGAEFLGQVVEESLFDMENEGFIIERKTDNIDCHLMADVALIRRVFGNIFSNLLKYADRSHPVTVEYVQSNKKLVIRFTNYVARDFTRKESCSIGLKTCETIMKSHEGRFICGMDGDRFLAEVEFCIR